MSTLDIPLLKARDMLGLVESREVVSEALESLSDPVDEDVLNLSLCDPSDQDCVERNKHILFQRARVDQMDRTEALTLYAGKICGDILDKNLDPLDGSKEIARAAIREDIEGFTELDPFIYILSEVDGRPSDREFFVNAAVREADSFSKRHPR